MIYVKLSGVPPSVNKAYETAFRMGTQGGRKKRVTFRRLSDEGRAYKEGVKRQIVQHHVGQLPYFKANHPYLLLIDFWFKRSRVYTATWNNGTKQAAQNRFKTFDVSNRVKLLEDAFAEAVGLDDAHNFFVGCGKGWTLGEEESTHIWVIDREAEVNNPIDKLFRELRESIPAP